MRLVASLLRRMSPRGKSITTVILWPSK
jgi:hypothetical protein